MGIFDFFRKKKKDSAAVAKDRLQIIVARERGASSPGADYLYELQQELLAVVAKYERLDLDQVTVRVDNRDDVDVLELNVVLPEYAEPEGGASGNDTAPGGKGGRSNRSSVAFAS